MLENHRRTGPSENVKSENVLGLRLGLSEGRRYHAGHRGYEMDAWDLPWGNDKRVTPLTLFILVKINLSSLAPIKITYLIWHHFK